MPLEKHIALQQLDLSGCRQISDLAPLEKLIALQRLDFSWCVQISDLAPLEKLTALQWVDLSGCEQISGLAPLEKLTALQRLYLSMCDQISDFAPLEKLTALQRLELSMCDQINDLAPLKTHTALQQLGLSGCDKICDLAPLEMHTALQQLDLSWCKQISDLAPLEKLTALQQLDLSGCEQISDLAPLGKLTALQRLDLSGCEQISDLAPLGRLAALQRLDLSGCGHISELAPLGKLTALQRLDLSGCEQISDLAPLGKLDALEELVLWNLNNSHSSCLTNLLKLSRLRVNNVVEKSSLLFQLPRLTSFIYYQEEQPTIGDVPAELLEGAEYENLLDRIIPWQQDILFSGAAPNTELKLFVLGNGRVGKTQISRRLQGQSFDPEIPSTHGVTLGRFPVLETEGEYPAMQLNLWDFGGQDIYLGTHGLFLDDRAIYVVAWHPDHENDREFFENCIPMRNRPLAYWLAYIRSLAGNDAPIIVVQTQCDEGVEEIPPPLLSEHGFGHLKSTASSAKSSHGMERLLPEIRSAARLLRKRYAAVEVPQSWVDMESSLRALREKGRKTLSLEDFAALCKERNSFASPALVAGFLHRAGHVFWRDGAFGNDLVLQQEWALKGIYALLERNDTLPQIRERHGRFHRAQLQARVWKDYGEDEQKLFLDMMTQCGACFPLDKDFYIATDLLPSERAMEGDIEAVWRDAEFGAWVELHYDFLHDGVIKSILARIGEKAGANGVYWRSGLCYYDRDAHGAVLIRAAWDEGQNVTRRGRITLMVAGSQASRLARHLAESIESLRIGKVSQILWQRGQQDEVQRHSEQREAVQEPFSGVAPEAKGNAAGAMAHVGVLAAFSTGQQNILLLATEWTSRHGGLSTFNRELCLALARMGKTVCCAMPQAGADEVEEAKKQNVILVLSNDATLLRPLPLPNGFAPDIIVGHGRITGEAAKAQQVDHFRQAKRVHFIHMAPGQIEWHKGKDNAAQKAVEREREELVLAQGAQLVAAVGPLLFREISTLIERMPSEKRPRVHQFNPGFLCQDSRLPPASLHCLLVGRAEDEVLKGIDIAARALQKVDESLMQYKPELVIRGAPAGTGTKMQIELTSKFKGLTSRVREYASDAEEIAGDYRSAALTLMPSRSEGFGLVALESLSYGTPVLISSRSGLAELLVTFLKSHELKHYVVDTPDDLEQAAKNWRERIEYQFSDIEAAIRRADKLRKILEENLTWAKSCDQLLRELR
ncbi:MAG: leucine-rich repeat domain-containing protein [Sideroxyarcus sp.]|nr:leucine-rich repeat domain-containing protein [Sideroxyarcus sp.]